MEAHRICLHAPSRQLPMHMTCNIYLEKPRPTRPGKITDAWRSDKSHGWFLFNQKRLGWRKDLKFYIIRKVIMSGMRWFHMIIAYFSPNSRNGKNVSWKQWKLSGDYVWWSFLDGLHQLFSYRLPNPFTFIRLCAISYLTFSFYAQQPLQNHIFSFIFTHSGIYPNEGGHINSKFSPRL